MAAPNVSRPKLAALDTNILIHLAQDDAPAHNLVLRLVRMGLVPIVTGTVVQELGNGAREWHPESLRRQAGKALSSMREWGIQPLWLKPVGNGIADVIANVIGSRRLLPEDEVNDAYILIESAFCDVTMLITWDRHFLDADNSALNELLVGFQLAPVQIVHPSAILDK